jgi:outer membrane receptor for ferrienterochelin and colicins
MKRLIAIYILIFVSVLTADATAEQLSGKVINKETNQPIEGANITVVEADRTVASDKHGEFVFKNLDRATFTIRATHIAFDPSEPVRVSLAEGNNSLVIKLNPAPWVLDEVVVTGTRSPHLLKDVPVQTEVVTRRDFQRTGATTVDQALSSSIRWKYPISMKSERISPESGDSNMTLIDIWLAVLRFP